MEEIQVNIVQQRFMDGYGVYIFQKDLSTNTVCVGEPITISPYEEMTDPPQTAFLSETTLQVMFEQLWTLGFRPKDYNEAHGELKSTKYHLEDMRKLLGIEDNL